jgi:peptide/nickel transport system permease protein
MLRDAQQIATLANYPWLLWPAVAVIIFVISMNFLGNGLRDAADPYAN